MVVNVTSILKHKFPFPILSELSRKNRYNIKCRLSSTYGKMKYKVSDGNSIKIDKLVRVFGFAANFECEALISIETVRVYIYIRLQIHV